MYSYSIKSAMERLIEKFQTALFCFLDGKNVILLRFKGKLRRKVNSVFRDFCNFCLCKAFEWVNFAPSTSIVIMEAHGSS